MINVDVVNVKKRDCDVSLIDLHEIFAQKLKLKISKADYDLDTDTIQILLKESVALATIDRLSTSLALRNLKVEEMSWEVKETSKGKVGFLNLVVS